MQSTYYERYMNGEEIAVWEELKGIENVTLAHKNWGDITDVLKETMRRVKFNVDTIYSRLKSMNYQFQEDTPRELPMDDVETKLAELKERVKPFGYIPLSLEFFYRIVGNVDFMAAYKSNFPYEYADPLSVAPVEYLLQFTDDDEGWAENMEDWTQEVGGNAWVDIAPDYYHKDNVSGGAPYGIALCSTPKADSVFTNTPYGDNLYFIDYLRLCFEWGGFPHIAANNNNYHDFINKLKTGLKLI